MNNRDDGGPALTRGYLLSCLMEEAGEVTQAAGKCQRFGFERRQPEYGQNDHVLAKEIGDLLGVADMLGLDQNTIEAYRRRKPKKVSANRTIAEPEHMSLAERAKP